MKVMDRHLGRQFLGVVAAAGIAFLALFLVVDFFEKLGMLLKYRPRGGDVALFFAAQIPWMTAQVVPMAAMLGTLLSLTALSKHGEITALRSGGVSLRRIAVPYLAGGLGLSLFAAGLQELAAPPSAAFAREVKEIRIKKRSARALLQAEDLWLRAGHRILHVDRVVPEEDRLVGVSLVELADGAVVRRIDAAEARWTADRWLLRHVEERSFASSGTIEVRNLEELPYPLSAGPDEFRIEKFSVQERPWRSLRRQIHKKREQGLDTREMEVGLWSKTSLPFASVVMPLLGFPFALRTGRRGGATLGIALGLTAGFVYWLAQAVALSLGNAGLLPPLLAAWSANLLFGGLGAGLLWRAERV